MLRQIEGDRHILKGPEGETPIWALKFDVRYGFEDVFAAVSPYLSEFQKGMISDHHAGSSYIPTNLYIY